MAGQAEPEYFVDLDVDPPCYCADQNYRGRETNHQCKHSIAGRLAALDPAMLHVIAASIERQMQQERDGIATRTKARKQRKAEETEA